MEDLGPFGWLGRSTRCLDGSRESESSVLYRYGPKYPDEPRLSRNSPKNDSSDQQVVKTGISHDSALGGSDSDWLRGCHS